MNRTTVSRAVRPAAALCLLGTLVACGGATELPARPIKEVATFTVASPVTDGVRNLSARLAASQRVELSFRVPGKLVELNVREGDLVKAGQLLAKLDQSEFETRLVDRRAAYESASSDYERAKVLIVDGAINKSDYDEVVAEYRISRATFEQAKVDMAYTMLRAPFDGEVSSRAVENFEEVTAGQQIFYVTDTSRMDVKFAVPESLMVTLPEGGGAPDGESARVNLRLADRPGQVLPMTFKEFAQRPDPATKTYEVTYQVAQPEDGVLLPGMTGTAQVELFDFVDGSFMVPSRVVYGDIYMQPRVWVLDQDSLTVSSRVVDIGRKSGRSLTINDGLEPGEVLVASHVSFLREGEQVTVSADGAAL